MFDDIIKKNKEKEQRMEKERIEGFNKVLSSYRIQKKSDTTQQNKPSSGTNSTNQTPSRSSTDAYIESLLNAHFRNNVETSNVITVDFKKKKRI